MNNSYNSVELRQHKFIKKIINKGRFYERLSGFFADIFNDEGNLVSAYAFAPTLDAKEAIAELHKDLREAIAKWSEKHGDDEYIAETIANSFYTPELLSDGENGVTLQDRERAAAKANKTILDIIDTKE